MSELLLVSIMIGAIQSGTPLLYATLSETIGERVGIINLGLEGIMLIGAVVGFVITVLTGNAALGVVAAALAGALFNMIFAFLVITRRANQLACGLALMFCGVGLSALIGAPFIGRQIEGLNAIKIPVFSDLPFFGRAFFQHDILVYLAIPTAVVIWWFLFKTRWGLSLRAVGENPTAAFAAGKNPYLLQYQVLFISGLLGGIAGAHLSLALAHNWAEWMTAGRGFFAVALVIFAKWHPLRAIAGALLFGGAISLQLQMQARGVPVSSFILDMLPYVLSLTVLVIWGRTSRSAVPGSLGRVFQGTE
ncbi:MAG: ABC transporter permease [Smithellaceae bacterium]|nr:ABC transporter permease [Smithellaceae bacterium]